MAKTGKKDTKMILVILVMLLLAVVYYQFVYVPQSRQIADMKQQKQDYETRIELINTKVSTLPELEKKLEEEKEKIYPMAKKYFGNVDQEDLILIINDLGNKSTIDIVDVSFKELENIEEYGLNFDLARQKMQQQSNNQTIEGQTATPNDENQNTQPAQGQSQPQEDQSANTQQQPTSEQPPTEGENAENDEEKFQNLKVTNVDISFLGTYADLKELVKLVDTNAQNIVSNQLSISKRDSFSEGYNSYGKNLDDYIEGDFNLRFFRVLSLEEYMPKKKSMFETKPIGKSPFDSPIASYAWSRKVDTQIGNVSGAYTTGGTTKAINNVSAIVGSGKAAQGNVTPKQIVEYKQPVELVRFDGLKDFVFMSEDDNNSGTISMDGVADINYKIIRADLEFSKESSLDKKAFVDVSGKKLRLKERPNTISMSLYSPKATGYEVGFVFNDADGQKVYVPLSEKMTFMGWKTIETGVDNVKFPASIESVYIKRSSQEDPVNGSLFVRF